MKLTARQAARKTGKSLPTITRAIKAGKISAEKTAEGGYLIDPSEVLRVFAPVTLESDGPPEMLHDATPSYPSDRQAWREKIEALETALAETRAERDEWRDQAKRLAMALPAPEPEPPAPPSSRWGWLWGNKA